MGPKKKSQRTNSKATKPHVPKTKGSATVAKKSKKSTKNSLPAPKKVIAKKSGTSKIKVKANTKAKANNKAKVKTKVKAMSKPMGASSVGKKGLAEKSVYSKKELSVAAKVPKKTNMKVLAASQVTKPQPKTRETQPNGCKKEVEMSNELLTATKAKKKKPQLTDVDSLIKNHMSLVEAVAHGNLAHIPQHIDRSDLISEGYIGLVEAARRFDPALGTKFSTFARTRILGSMLDWLRSIDILPRSAREKQKAIESATNIIAQETGRQPSPMQVADRLGIPLEEHYKNVALLSCSFIPIDQRKTETVSGRDFYFIDVPDEKTQTPDDAMFTRDKIRSIRERADRLNEEDGLILSLISFEGMNLKEVGYLLDFSASTVRQRREKSWDSLASLFK